MTTIKMYDANNNGNERLYKATINGSTPMDATGNKLFNKAVDMSLIVFPEWQRTETSNDGKIKKLIQNFDENLMDPIILVAHPEDNTLLCVNGFHRTSALVALGKSEAPATILMFHGSLKERTRFEVDLFLKQSISTEPLKEIQMHSARLEIGDIPATTIEKLCKEYGITVVPTKGHRAARVLGSYNSTYEIAQTKGGSERLAEIFKVLDIAGYMEEANGLSSKIMVPVGNIIKEYPFVTKELGEMMRTMSPNILMSKAVASYPERGWRVQLTLYIQDWVVDTYHVEPRYNEKGKTIKVA